MPTDAIEREREAERNGAAAFDSYSTLLNARIIVPAQKTSYVAVERNHLVTFMGPFIARIHFDEAWYLERNPDVAEAIERGEVESAAVHYREAGYFEHRMPYDIAVDEVFYLSEYPDVAAAVAEGHFGSAEGHFAAMGFAEGRLPCAGFRLRAAEVVPAEAAPTEAAPMEAAATEAAPTEAAATDAAP